MAVVSVIGPDGRLVENVVDGLRPTRHRVVAGAGPAQADGVVAVVDTGTVGAGGTDGADYAEGADGANDATDAVDAGVVRAVRDAMGVCVLYINGDAVSDATIAATDIAEVAAEPGVIVCGWSGEDGPAAAASLAALRDTVDGLWVDLARWSADARRADADRLDRVRIAVRLAAERLANELLVDAANGPHRGLSRPDDADELDQQFRSRLAVAVLEQGVEMPNLGMSGRDIGSGGRRESGDTGAVDTPQHQATTAATAVTAATALGAGAAAAAAVTRLTGSVVLAAVVALPVSAATFLARWWSQRSNRRTQAASRQAADLRRHWAATVTDVVSRIQIPPVADSLAETVSWTRGTTRATPTREVVA